MLSTPHDPRRIVGRDLNDDEVSRISSVCYHAVSLLVQAGMAEVGRPHARNPRITECGSTGRHTYVLKESADACALDFDFTVDFNDISARDELDAMVKVAGHRSGTMERFLGRRGLGMRCLGTTWYRPLDDAHPHAKVAIELQRASIRLGLEVNACIWGRDTYSDVFERQLAQVRAIGGSEGVETILADIRTLKDVLAAAGIARATPEAPGLSSVAIEQLIIQSTRSEQDPLVIEAVGNLQRAMKWILSSQHGERIVVFRTADVASTVVGDHLDRLSDSQWDSLCRVAQELLGAC